MRYAKSDIVLGGFTPLPLNRYTVRIITAQVATSQKEGAQPTLRIQCEIIAPPTVKHEGSTYGCLGRKFNLMPNRIDPTEPWGLGRILTGLEKSNFDFTAFNPEGEIDTDKFIVLVGHTMDMRFTTREAFATRAVEDNEVGDADQSGYEKPNGRFKFIVDVKGNRMSRGHFIVNEQGVSPGWDEVIGPASGDDGNF